jgi:hypothetical protein
VSRVVAVVVVLIGGSYSFLWSATDRFEPPRNLQSDVFHALLPALLFTVLASLPCSRDGGLEGVFVGGAPAPSDSNAPSGPTDRVLARAPVSGRARWFDGAVEPWPKAKMSGLMARHRPLLSHKRPGHMACGVATLSWTALGSPQSSHSGSAVDSTRLRYRHLARASRRGVPARGSVTVGS